MDRTAELKAKIERLQKKDGAADPKSAAADFVSLAKSSARSRC
jgi:hypothetical protein